MCVRRSWSQEQSRVVHTGASHSCAPGNRVKLGVREAPAVTGAVGSQCRGSQAEGQLWPCSWQGLALPCSHCEMVSPQTPRCSQGGCPAESLTRELPACGTCWLCPLLFA